MISDKKTIEKRYVSYLNCSFNNPRKSMENTKNLYHDKSDILAFHGFQSFEEGELDADLAHKIGVEFAEIMWGNRFEVIVSTHLDTDNIHNHFLINSTSFVDGKRYCNTKSDLYRMRNVSDQLCRDYGLFVIENIQYKGKTRASYFQDKSLRGIVQEDIDEAISLSYDMRQFYNELTLMGYEIKETENNIAVKHPMAKKYIRLKSIGSDYTKEKVIDKVYELQKETRSEFSIYDRLGFNIKPYYEESRSRTLTSLQKLFLYYQYKLKIIPKRTNTKLSPEVKKEMIKAVKKMDSLCQQTIILCKNNLHTIDQLNKYIDDLENRLDNLLKIRQKYRNKARYCDDEKNAWLKEKAKSLSSEISKLRKELANCKEIECRSLGMAKFLEEERLRERKKQYER